MMIAIYDSDGISLSRRTESQIRFCCNFYETCTKKIHTIKCLSKSAHIEVIFEHLLSFIGTFDLNLMYT